MFILLYYGKFKSIEICSVYPLKVECTEQGYTLFILCARLPRSKVVKIGHRVSLNPHQVNVLLVQSNKNLIW